MLIDFARELLDLECTLRSYGVDSFRRDTDHVPADGKAEVSATIAEYGAMVRATGYTLGYLYCVSPYTQASKDWYGVCEAIRVAVRDVCTDHNAETLDKWDRIEVHLILSDRLETLRSPALA